MNEHGLKPSSITFQVRDGNIRCEAWIPANSHGLIVLTHGTGSYRVNPEITRTTKSLYDRKIAVVAADLLTAKEYSELQNRFNTELVSQRLVMLVRYLEELPVLSYLPVCLLGIGTGADAVLSAASRISHKIKAVSAINGFHHQSNILDSVFPSTVPTLLLYQETLGLNSTNTYCAPLNKSNVSIKKLYKSDETIPLEGIYEATEWLTKIIKQSGPGEVIREREVVEVHG